MLLDNKKNGKVGDKFGENISTDSKLSIISGLFSIYGFEELKKELVKVESVRFLFSNPPLSNEGLPSYLIQGLNGDEYERRFQNQLNQTNIAKECADWLSQKAQIKVVKKPHTLNQNLFHINNQEDSMAISGSSHFTASGLGYGFEVNTLTVMANESYDEFVRQLQREIEDEEGIRFGMVEKHTFANIVVEDEHHASQYLGADVSERIWDHLLEQDYIDQNGKIKDRLRKDLKVNCVNLPEDLKEQASQITASLKKVAGSLNIKNAGEKESVNLNKAVYLGEEFKELWNRIKYKTTFRVDFKVDELIQKCAEYIKSVIVGKTKFIYSKDKVKILKGGIEGGEIQESIHVYGAKDFQLPDIISFLQNETNLTRKTLVEILTTCGRLNDFKNNPQKFIDEVSSIIKNQMRHVIVDGIKYEKIGTEHYYAQELFENQELNGYLNKNMQASKKSVYEYVVYDSDVEADFAKSMEQSKDIKLYAKLPDWFKIDTPLGSYNPDWAVLVARDNEEKLYFVVETKGNMLFDMLRPAEQAKIDCGQKHFSALGEKVGFAVADRFETFMDRVV